MEEEIPSGKFYCKGTRDGGEGKWTAEDIENLFKIHRKVCLAF